MQHLQRNVTGLAKSAIEGYGYSGESYFEALRELEIRFGKTSLVIQAILGKLRKANRLAQDSKPSDIRSLSDLITTTVWTLKRFGYANDLAAQANLSLAESKLSNDLKIKWREHTKHQNLSQPSLPDLSLWLKDRAAMYDELQLPKKPPAKVPPYPNRYGKNKSGDDNTSSDHTLAESVSSKPNCIMNDSQQHNLWECPKFLSMNVENRLKEVRGHGLCFSCLGRRHWSSQCRLKKKCGVNGCSKSHHALLHSVPTMEEPTQANGNPGGVVNEHSNASHTNSKFQVLLQVVPIVKLCI